MRLQLLRHRAAAPLFWALLQYGSSTVFGIVTVPLTLAYLGRERFGLWMLVLSSLAFTSLLDSGFTPTLLNRLIRAHSHHNHEEFAYYSYGGLLLGLVLTCMGLLLVPLAGFVDWPVLLSITSETARGETLPLIRAVLIVNVLAVGAGHIDNVFYGQLKLVRPRVYSVIANVAGFGSLLCCLRLDTPLWTLAVANSSPRLIARIPLLVQLLGSKGSSPKTPWRSLPLLIRAVIPSSFAFLGVQLFSVMQSSLPNLILSRQLNLGEVAHLNVMARFYQVPLSMIAAVLPILWPFWSSAYARGDATTLRRGLHRLIGGTVAVGLVYACLLLRFGNGVLLLWTRGQIGAPSGLLFGIGIWALVAAVVYWCSTMLHSFNDFGFELWCYALSTGLLFAISLSTIAHLGIGAIVLSGPLSLLLGSALPMWARIAFLLRLERVGATASPFGSREPPLAVPQRPPGELVSK